VAHVLGTTIDELFIFEDGKGRDVVLEE
jgi:hypothetical protein